MEIIRLGLVLILAEIFLIESFRAMREYVETDRYLKSYVGKDVVDKVSYIKYTVNDYSFNLVGEKILRITHDNILYIYVHPGEVKVIQKNNLLKPP